MCVWCLFFVLPLLAPLVDLSVNMRSVKISRLVNFHSVDDIIKIHVETR